MKFALSTLSVSLTLALAGAALIAPANAQSIEEICTAAVKAEGGSEEALAGCTCLQEKVDGNPALEEELISLGPLGSFEARLEAASEDGKAALLACFAPAG